MNPAGSSDLLFCAVIYISLAHDGFGVALEGGSNGLFDSYGEVGSRSVGRCFETLDGVIRQHDPDAALVFSFSHDSFTSFLLVGIGHGVFDAIDVDVFAGVLWIGSL